MPVETASTIDQLDITNPAATDPVAEADDHLRLIKSAIKTSFPNLVGTLTASTADLNRSALAFTGTGSIKIPLNGTLGAKIDLLPAINTGTISVINNGGLLNVMTTDTVGANPHTVVSVDYAGTLTALGGLNAPILLQSGYSLVPSGVIMLWGGTVASIPAGWVLCDGTSGTPDLRDRFILGAGGAFLAGVTGGAASQSGNTGSAGSHTPVLNPAGAHTPSVTLGAAGGHSHGGLVGDHTLSYGEMPYHTHEVPGERGGGGDLAADYAFGRGGNSPPALSGGSFAAQPTSLTSGAGGNLPHSHTITSEADHTHTATATAVPDHNHTASAVPDHQHSISVTTVPPFFTLAYIMKV